MLSEKLRNTSLANRRAQEQMVNISLSFLTNCIIRLIFLQNSHFKLRFTLR